MTALPLPTNWSTSTILASALKIMDYRGRTPKKLGMDWGGGRIPAISARNVRMGCIDFTEEHYLGSENLYRRWMTHGDTQRGDAIITTEAPLGNVAPVPDDSRYILSQRVVLIRPQPEIIDKTYFVKLLQSPGFQEILGRNATGSTALGIRRKRLEQLPVPVPPLPEQEAIGQALEDMDEMIFTLESLIAKKRAIRKGLMQKLLTGGVRLPGFTERWTSGSLGDVATLQRGFDLPARLRHRGAVPIVSSSGISGWHSRAMVKAPGVVTGRYGTIGDVFFETVDFWPLNTTLWVSNFHGNDARFIYYLLQRIDFASHSGKSGVPGVNRNDLHSESISLPDSIAEQQAIAGALDEAGKECDVLKDRLSKARAIKIGMMQQLLTGRTRLPV